MAPFICSRCGYESLRNENFTRHLRRKYPCRPKLQDVPVNDLLRKHFNYKSQVESPGWMEFIKNLNPNESKRIQMNPHLQNRRNRINTSVRGVRSSLRRIRI